MKKLTCEDLGLVIGGFTNQGESTVDVNDSLATNEVDGQNTNIDNAATAGPDHQGPNL